MRIILGTHKGRRIYPNSSFSARPTTDFAKENIFNVISNLKDIQGLKVLDLFSGTGSIGYEFASRGASEIISVESNFNHYSFIKKTASDFGFTNMKIYKKDVFWACNKLKGKKFDIVFADPPYNLDKISLIPDLIFHNSLVADEGLVIVEHPAEINFEDHDHFLQRRVYGAVNFSIFS